MTCGTLKSSHSPLPRDIKLENIFCLKYERNVKADNTISFEGRTYQIRPNKQRWSNAKAKVEIRLNLSKNLEIYGHI
ncbi:MAG: hypothetical protein ABIE74_01620 [Pseudomonadota bacterium]